jgi:hypothetical protein
VYVVILIEQFTTQKLHILGIFCTRQKAEKVIELRNINSFLIKEVMLDDIINLEAV